MKKNFLLAIAFLALSAFADGYKGPVEYYGSLSANGNKIVGSNFGTEKPVQLRGISFFWSCTQWGEPEGSLAAFWSAASVGAMADGFKAEVVRAAMAANDEGGCGDYQSNKTATLNMVKTVADEAIKKDIYIIIDWHSHKASSQQVAAIDFFVNEMKSYHNIPNVIFEIFNEPTDQSWSTIKNYETAVIKALRDAGANNLVLAGTPKWDQEVDAGANDLLTDNNVAYVQHFYANSHQLSSTTADGWQSGKTFQKAAENILAKNKPVFVSEYGTVSADGGGAVNANATNAWHAFMDNNKISSCIWAWDNKNEGASIFKTNFNPPSSGSDAAWTNTGNLTDNGTYIKNKLASYAETAEWRNAEKTTPIISRPISLNTIPQNAKITVYDFNGNLVGSVLPKSAGIYIVKAQFDSNPQTILVTVP